MKLQDLFEGEVKKRLDPYISGDKDEKYHPREVKPAPVPAPPPKPSAFDTKIANLASKSRLSVSAVHKIWADEKKKLDPKLPNLNAILMSNVQRKLGLKK